MSGHWRDSRLQRRFVLGFYVALALAVLAATATVIVAVSSSSAKLADRLAEAGDVLAGGTLLLAAIAALVALHAYANVTGLPDLKFKMQFPFSECNQPTFETSAGEYGWRAEPFEQPHMTVSLHNASGYSARNPAVIVRLKAMRFNKSGDWPRDTDWAVIDF